MNQNKSYKCLSVKLFDTWRITFYGFLILSLFLGTILQDVKSALFISIIIILIVAMIHIGSSYSEVTLSENSVKLQNFSKVIHLNNFQDIETWWSYDYGISTIELSEGTQGKSRASSNKINCFVKFKSGENQVFIYEQLHLSGKFPNGHEYLPNEKVDKSKMIRVWGCRQMFRKIRISKKTTD